MTKVRRGEEVERDPRRAMTDARKRSIWEARGGRCGVCGEPVEQFGRGVVYDHIIPLWIKGSDANKDIWPIHKDPCDNAKTPQDLKRIAKTKRQRAKHLGERAPSKRPIKSRGFSTAYSKGFDGKVRPRKHRDRADHDEGSE